MNNPFKTHGAFSWAELMTTDQEGAKKFYGALFGWSLEDMPMEGMNYTVVKANEQDEKGVAGIMAMPKEVPPGTPPHWGNYVTVDDVDALAAKVGELGGTIIMPPKDIPGVGRFLVFQDPQGAVLSAITYSEESGC